MESVRSFKPATESVTEARVLLIGPVGAGKSSFISSVQSVFSGRVINRAMVGSSSSTSFTKKVNMMTRTGIKFEKLCYQSESEDDNQPPFTD